jgi:hypothetical protein
MLRRAVNVNATVELVDAEGIRNSRDQAVSVIHRQTANLRALRLRDIGNLLIGYL